MKKYMVAGGVWLALIMTLLTCNSKTTLSYEIRFDDKTEKTYEVKEAVQDAYADLVRGVHEESYVLMVLHNLEQFEVAKDVHADWQKNHLVITQGDGKGTVITGELVANSICMPEVQPRSLFQEIFG